MYNIHRQHRILKIRTLHYNISSGVSRMRAFRNGVKAMLGIQANGRAELCI